MTRLQEIKKERKSLQEKVSNLKKELEELSKSSEIILSSEEHVLYNQFKNTPGCETPKEYLITVKSVDICIQGKNLLELDCKVNNHSATAIGICGHCGADYEPYQTQDERKEFNNLMKKPMTI